MKQFKLILSKIFLINAVFLFFMSLYRLIFFLNYKKGVDLEGLGFDILKSFYWGIRFDLSVLSYINALPLLVFIIAFLAGQTIYFKTFFKFLQFYYTATVGILAVLYIIDFNFYGYFQDHINIMIYGFFEDDTSALLSTFYQHYNLFLILFAMVFVFFAVFLLSKNILKLKKYIYPLPTLPMRIIISVLSPIILFILMRGTFAWNAIGTYSDISSNVFLNKTAINCAFTLQRAVEHKNRENKDPDYVSIAGYKDGIRQAFADFLGKDINEIPIDKPENSLISFTAKNAEIEKIKPNVILIIMESFGADLIKYQSADFDVLGSLKKHFDSGIVFYNFASEESVTVSAIEALFLNIQERPITPVYLAQSKYAKNKYLFSAMLPYKEKNYRTIFIYGDNTSWRNIGEFALNNGYDKALSGDGYGYTRGPWGIFDEFLFDLVFKELEKESQDGKQSIFITALTTTNHPPYTLPENYKPLPLTIPDSLKEKIFDMDTAKKRFLSYQYANEMLGRFIDKIKNSKYAENTIIAVTGDHSSNSHSIKNFRDSISVPFYLYVPPKLKPKNYNLNVLGSHLDIMPTLYNLSLSSAQFMSEGIDLFSAKAADNFIMYKEFMMDKNYASGFNLSNWLPLHFTLKNGGLEPSQFLPQHVALSKKLLSITAISDYLLKKTGQK
ncbi:MAG: sulfatase-like hydrolase/transferase [Elusimicrobiota bacterium]|jgi:phosphoglycerol transferase MdoB-like AlkP superfamily enzyme|nr:sulfatase-like hydrolase/transferase [Elusimicrobiota bacterium]